MKNFEIWYLFSCMAGRPLFFSDHILIVHGTINSKLLCASTFYVLREVVEAVWDEFPCSYRCIFLSLARHWYTESLNSDSVSLWSFLSVIFPLETPCSLLFIFSLKFFQALSAILFSVARAILVDPVCRHQLKRCVMHYGNDRPWVFFNIVSFSIYFAFILFYVWIWLIWLI